MGVGVANPDLDLSLPDSGRLRSQVRICQVEGGLRLPPKPCFSLERGLRRVATRARARANFRALSASA